MSIVDETDDENDADQDPEEDEPPQELMEPSEDPTTTCMRVADRLDRCNTQRAAISLDDLAPEDRAQAVTALTEAAGAIASLRSQCRGKLSEDDARYVQALGRCLPLTCTTLRECVARTQ